MNEHRPAIFASIPGLVLGIAWVLLPVMAHGQPLPQVASTIASPSGMAALQREQIVSVGQGFRTISAGTNGGSLQLAWEPSPDKTTVGYRLYWGAASGSYTNSAAVGNTTNCTITGLAIATTFYFAATAYDTNGLESAFSNEATGFVPWKPPVLSIRPYIYIVEGTTVPNHTNRVQESSNLTNWATVMLFVGGTNGVWSMLVTNNAPQRFYRVKVE